MQPSLNPISSLNLSLYLVFTIFTSSSIQTAQAEPYVINWQNGPAYTPKVGGTGVAAGSYENTAYGAILTGKTSASASIYTYIANAFFDFHTVERDFIVSKSSPLLSNTFTLKLTGTPAAGVALNLND